MQALKNGRQLRGNAHLPSAAGCFFKALAQALTAFKSDLCETIPEEEEEEEGEEEKELEEEELVAARRQQHDERALVCLREDLGNFTVMRGMSLADVRKYEEELNSKRNDRPVAISVFVYEAGEGYIPASPSPRRAEVNVQHVHLLLVPSQVEEQDKSQLVRQAKQGKTLFDKMQAQHYFWIPDLSRLMSYSHLTHSGKRRRHRCHVCVSCLSVFAPEETLKRHTVHCSEPQKHVYPEPGQRLYFRNHKHGVKRPLMAFLDFESKLIRKSKEEQAEMYECAGCLNDSLECHHKTTVTHVHKPATFCLVMIDLNREIKFEKTYSGDDVMKVFFNTVIEMEQKFFKLVSSHTRHLCLTREEQADFDQASHCYLCQKHFEPPATPAQVAALRAAADLSSPEGRRQFAKEEKARLKREFSQRKCRDHCHYTGKLCFLLSCFVAKL